MVSYRLEALCNGCCPLTCIFALVVLPSFLDGSRFRRHSQSKHDIESTVLARECDESEVGNRQIILIRHGRVDTSEIKSHGVLHLAEDSHFKAEIVGQKLAAYIGRKMLVDGSAENRTTLFYFLRKPAQDQVEEFQVDETALEFVRGFDLTVDSAKEVGLVPNMQRITRAKAKFMNRQLSTEDLSEKLLNLVNRGSSSWTDEVARGTGDVVAVVSQEFMAEFLLDLFGDEEGQAEIMSLGRRLFKSEPKYTLTDVVNKVKKATSGAESWGEVMYNNGFMLICKGGHWVVGAFPYSTMEPFPVQ